MVRWREGRKDEGEGEGERVGKERQRSRERKGAVLKGMRFNSLCIQGFPKFLN